jgi:hypothetical protein
LTRREALTLVAAAWTFHQSGPRARAIELDPKTKRGFDQYMGKVLVRVKQRAGGTPNFLWAEDRPERLAAVRKGQVVVEQHNREPLDVGSGLIHDWIGSVFIPGASLDRVLSMVSDYDRHHTIYPEVIGSRTLSQSGDQFRVHLRLLKRKVISVVLNTEHDVRYFRLTPSRAHSESFMTRVAEVEDAGEPGEHEKPPGEDHGFLWALNSFWRFDERDGGVFVECEAVSLSRDVPLGLGWMMKPIIRDLPRESLEGTLKATRKALAQ